MKWNWWYCGEPFTPAEPDRPYHLETHIAEILDPHLILRLYVRHRTDIDDECCYEAYIAEIDVEDNPESLIEHYQKTATRSNRPLRPRNPELAQVVPLAQLTPITLEEIRELAEFAAEDLLFSPMQRLTMGLK